MSDWTFFSNYGHVLVCLANDNEARLRDVASEVGITERAAQKIVKDLQEAGFITITKQGRRNRYQINRRKALRHGLESHCTIGKVLSLVVKKQRPVRPIAAPVTEVSEQKKAKPTEVLPVEVETRYPMAANDEKPVTEKQPGVKEKDETLPLDTREQGSLF